MRADTLHYRASCWGGRLAAAPWCHKFKKKKKKILFELSPSLCSNILTFPVRARFFASWEVTTQLCLQLSLLPVSRKPIHLPNDGFPMQSQWPSWARRRWRHALLTSPPCLLHRVPNQVPYLHPSFHQHFCKSLHPMSPTGLFSQFSVIESLHSTISCLPVFLLTLLCLAMISSLQAPSVTQLPTALLFRFCSVKIFIPFTLFTIQTRDVFYFASFLAVTLLTRFSAWPTPIPIPISLCTAR